MPETFLEPLRSNQKRWNRIMFLKNIFEDQGHEIRIAGGAVRDILRGKVPDDIDLATTSTPETTLKIMEPYHDVLRIIYTDNGIKHGTVAAKFKEIEGNLDFKRRKLDDRPLNQTAEPTYDDETPFEITTLRRDSLTDGRHAKVNFVTDWKMDAERRDLTINAMFLSLDGKLTDHFNGRSDLEAGIIRFAGVAECRIREDYLRILRYLRFWSRYGKLDPDEKTLEAIRGNLEGLDSISGERIWMEIKKIFSELPCHKAVGLMFRLNLQDHVGLECPQEHLSTYRDQSLAEIKTVQQKIISFKESHPEYVNDDKKICGLLPIIAFAALVKDESMCKSSHLRLKYSNMERDVINAVVAYREQDIDGKTVRYQLLLAPPPMVENLRFTFKAISVYKGQADLIQATMFSVPKFPIDGHMVAGDLKKKKVPKRKIQGVIGALRKDWAESQAELTKDDLLQRIDVKLNEMI